MINLLCSKGYPDKFEKNILLKNINSIKLDHNKLIYHASTQIKNNEIVSSGGRVLNFVGISPSYKTSREIVINLIKQLNWENGFYRKDIGYKVID